MKVIVIGGGPAGMLAAIAAAEAGDQVMILEKNEQLGKKILITGKGRCNITSSLEMDEFMKNIPGNGRFLYSAFHQFTNQDIIQLLQKQGVKVKEERGNRIFPVSDRAEDVRSALEREVKKKSIQIRKNAVVKELIVGTKQEETMSQFMIGVKLQNEEEIKADKVILATGGKSYPQTGSTGDGYWLARNVGHTVTKIQGSLVPLKAEEYLCQNMQGLSLKNVGIKIIDIEKGKKIYEDFGEMLFTHFGVTGPIIISASSHLIRYKNVEELLKNERIELSIDLKPALTLEKLDIRIRRDFEKYKNRELKNSLDELLPQKIIGEIISLSKINPFKRVNEITKEERTVLGETIKNFKLTISKFRPIEEAIVTARGNKC